MEGIDMSISADLSQTDNAAASVNGHDPETRRKQLRKQDGIKRACNGCRQQKVRDDADDLSDIEYITEIYTQLRCDVVQQPFSTCSRCRRLDLACKIDAAFQRIEKRRYHSHH